MKAQFKVNHLLDIILTCEEIRFNDGDRSHKLTADETVKDIQSFSWTRLKAKHFLLCVNMELPDSEQITWAVLQESDLLSQPGKSQMQISHYDRKLLGSWSENKKK